MTRLTDCVHEILGRHVREGDVVIDATMGNGHDTLALARLVGPNGVVHAFDLQEAALESTARRLEQADIEHVQFHLACHTRMREYLGAAHGGGVAAVVFNLGYLPGGRKNITTRAESSAAAVRVAYDLLADRGILSVLAYVGHDGGLQEAEGVDAALDTLPGRVWLARFPHQDRVEARAASTIPAARGQPSDTPRLFVVQRGVATADRRKM